MKLFLLLKNVVSRGEPNKYPKLLSETPLRVEKRSLEWKIVIPLRGNLVCAFERKRQYRLFVYRAWCTLLGQASLTTTKKQTASNDPATARLVRVPARHALVGNSNLLP
ncbi:hypothetical protein AVEN_133932-1 [Araneus ventricosus]|uniref:Uncharacterized protein n=1 Tax=Araneus ventricosus TaxID=182803 RepID=A0A4Y2D6K2_ARAVE|nr:hypothetical protein AVEN_133932-1 [Araneus ventricosus]